MQHIFWTLLGGRSDNKKSLEACDEDTPGIFFFLSQASLVLKVHVLRLWWIVFDAERLVTAMLIQNSITCLDFFFIKP